MANKYASQSGNWSTIQWKDAPSGANNVYAATGGTGGSYPHGQTLGITDVEKIQKIINDEKAKI